MSVAKRAGHQAPAVHDGQHLITLAQKLARDAEHHALLSASLASQADRLMIAGLKMLQRPAASCQLPAAPSPQRPVME
jgi:hypothetical protein